MLFKLLRPLASLQLTVVLFALSTVLVFFGTVAMMNQSLWTVVDEYFRSTYVWIPLDLIRQFGIVFFDLSKDGKPWPGAMLFPGGWLLGAVMLANLIAAHLVRFKVSWKRSGIIITHLGVIVLMVGELITGLYAVESTMMIRVGETASFVDVSREYEIAVTEKSNPEFDTVTTIPQHFFRNPGMIETDQLPFRIEVQEFWKNTNEERLMQAPAPAPEVFPVTLPGGANMWFRLSQAKEGAGVDTDVRGDIPSVRVKILAKNSDQELGSFLLSLWAYDNFELNRRVFQFPNTEVTVDGKTYRLLLRNKRVDKPYSIKLLEFEHGKYPGTDIPKDFASTVLVTDKETGDDREVRIWMNNPLRHAGDSLFQHAVLFEDSGTVLQVVRNPGRLLPYISCLMVTLGMIVHFGIRLSGFLQKSKGAR